MSIRQAEVFPEGPEPVNLSCYRGLDRRWGSLLIVLLKQQLDRIKEKGAISKCHFGDTCQLLETHSTWTVDGMEILLNQLA